MIDTWKVEGESSENFENIMPPCPKTHLSLALFKLRCPVTHSVVWDIEVVHPLPDAWRIILHPSKKPVEKYLFIPLRAAHPMPHAVDVSKAAMAQGFRGAVGAFQAPRGVRTQK